MTYHRPELALGMAEQLIRPKGLQISVRSGLFLGGLRRIGKTTFLRGDLVPALENLGAIVIYVDLWSNTNAKPTDLLLAEVRKKLAELQSVNSRAIGLLKRVKGLDLGAVGFKFAFGLDELGKPEGATLADAFVDLVDQGKTDVVVIVDEVQHAMGSEDGNSMLLALKAARDAINTRPDTPGHFLFLGTGSHRARVRELTIKGNQAFNGALSQDFPVLGDDFVAWLLEESALGERTPTLKAASDSFQRLGRRPEELMKALLALQAMAVGQDPDADLRAITEAVRQSAAVQDLARLDQLGPVAQSVFARVVSEGGHGVRGLFSESSLDEYGKALGRRVAQEEIQPATNALLDANLLARDGHGIYGVSDPFVAEAFLSRQTMHQKLSGNDAQRLD
ncbi:ATP-binding protein [Roseateles amylovorans]|uniref:ATP-binding protein n=1 Tax=Roseateles amylovorans TaxID=2978473 RepID=A0ABY6B1T2_9BURK|nr:ATP-binding protein [Roseateles amylovorans]UXH77478.1 ATP-binding protein [Roseateles amylovorans]